MRTKPLCGLLLLSACASGPVLDNPGALGAERLEIAMDWNGRAAEIEYHVSPEVVPAAVRAAMDDLHPGGKTTAAEKEFEGSSLYWELVKEIDGVTVQAMFESDGTLRSQEFAVSEEEVPLQVLSAVVIAGYGPAEEWEVVQDGQQELLRYHAKTRLDGRDYKLLVSPAGRVEAVFREIEAEIEIPVE